MSGTVEMPRLMRAAEALEVSPLAGKPAPKEMLVDLARPEKEYFDRRPDLGETIQLMTTGCRLPICRWQVPPDSHGTVYRTSRFHARPLAGGLERRMQYVAQGAS